MNSYLNVFLTDKYEEIKEHYIKVTELSKNGSVENEEILLFQADASTSTSTSTGKDRVVQIAHNLKFSKVFLSNQTLY